MILKINKLCTPKQIQKSILRENDINVEIDVAAMLKLSPQLTYIAEGGRLFDFVSEIDDVLTYQLVDVGFEVVFVADEMGLEYIIITYNDEREFTPKMLAYWIVLLLNESGWNAQWSSDILHAWQPTELSFVQFVVDNLFDTPSNDLMAMFEVAQVVYTEIVTTKKDLGYSTIYNQYRYWGLKHAENNT